MGKQPEAPTITVRYGRDGQSRTRPGVALPPASKRGAGVASRPGSAAHDIFALEGGDVVRTSNRAGGIEGGMSNGQPITLRVSVKPIPTLMKALPSVNLHEGTDAPASIVRSDVCVVPAAAVVGEAMVRLALAAPVLEKYGGDSMDETLDNLHRSRAAAATLFERAPGGAHQGVQ